MAYRKIEQYDHDTTEQIASHIKAILGLQVQERLPEQIRDCIQESLQPLGVAVVIEAMHTCNEFLKLIEK